jgi:signal transduction histidine kinase
VAGLIAATGAGLDLPLEWILPGVVLLAAVWLAWSQLDKADPAAPRGTFSWIRLGGAIALVVLAVSLLITRGSDTVSVVAVLAAGLAVLAGVALVLAPWGLRLLAALGDQRAATAREAERADIAAHLHDSVLQTLAVIRSQADDPAAVRHLARAQERELREWLYQDRSEPGQSTAAALRTVAGEVEDLTTVEIGVVVVGDHRPNEGLSALVAATREALLNAARHGAAPVSLYAEFSPRQAEVFVRDRGEGFDLTSVPADRLGVRESILGRVRRHGGHAEIRSGGPGQGTEVCLRLALTPPDPAPTAAQEQVSPARKAKPSAEERVSPARKDKP